MGFVVRAVLAEHGGTYTAEFETRKAPVKSATELRERTAASWLILLGVKMRSLAIATVGTSEAMMFPLAVAKTQRKQYGNGPQGRKPEKNFAPAGNSGSGATRDGRGTVGRTRDLSPDMYQGFASGRPMHPPIARTEGPHRQGPAPGPAHGRPAKGGVKLEADFRFE
jgi:hypothetical protein